MEKKSLIWSENEGKSDLACEGLMKVQKLDLEGHWKERSLRDWPRMKVRKKEGYC